MENSLVWNQHNERMDYQYNHSINNDDTTESSDHGDLINWLIMGTHFFYINRLSTQLIMALTLTFNILRSLILLAPI